MKMIERKICHYFIDEAGDATLFDSRGRVIIGNEGCSEFFMLGYADIPDPVSIGQEMEELRQQLLADPYFRRVPSMQPERQRTALFFHAKDDPTEVRWQVFSLLRHHPEIRFHAVVRDKRGILAFVRQSNLQDSNYHYNTNEQYDYLVRQLLRHVLHQYDEYQLTFATRGTSNRTAALKLALETARTQFQQKSGITALNTIQVIPGTPQRTAGLQVTDYFLWALQRFYERSEDRYVEYLQESIRYVHDIDDTREEVTGRRYTRKKPLKLAALPNRESK
ncbi:MAG: DUF3800 domain-containing protein [Caldilineaceae bacterium]